MNRTSIIIIAPIKPLAYKARGKAKYQAALANEARNVALAPLLATRLYSKAYYWHRGKATIDADNLSKPILDALKGIVYEDDAQVVLRATARVALESDSYELVQHGIDPERYQRLITLIAEEPQVLYIEVGELTSFRLNLGSPDGEDLLW